MTVGITVGGSTDEIGAPSFLHAFFSTMSVHCEPNGWGTRFPNLMKRLYQGKLEHRYAVEALGELNAAHEVLSTIPPSSIVWDIENRAAKPPWGDDIAETITSLGNYFVTSSGRDLFDLLREALEASRDENSDAVLS